MEIYLLYLTACYHDFMNVFMNGHSFLLMPIKLVKVREVGSQVSQLSLAQFSSAQLSSSRSSAQFFFSRLNFDQLSSGKF